MKTGIWPAVGAGALFSLSAVAQTAPEVTLTRIECGTGAKPTMVAERFSDTFAYSKDLALTFTFSCYLIRHGDGDPHARPHARALEPPRAPQVGKFPAGRRRRALPRELRIERRAGLQLRPRADGRVDRADEEDRREPQRHRDHPARPARHRQAAGFSGCSEVVAASRNEGGSGSRADFGQRLISAKTGHGER